MRSAILQPLPTAFHVMTKPVGPICNLACRYCFYLEKEDWIERPRSWRMPDDVLDAYVRQYIEGQESPEISFAWQGGEPTLLGIAFFQNVLRLQKKYANGKRIYNALQTNGTLLDDEWCAFFRENAILIGISIDGPRELHDACRVDKRNRSSFDAVMRGLDLLRIHRVDFNALTVVNRYNSRRPLDVYRFLKEIGSGFLQFIPLVERVDPAPRSNEGELLSIRFAPPPRESDPKSAITEESVRAASYGDFLCQIFDEWVRHDIGTTFVQLFDVALGNWSGMGGGLCVFSEKCGSALAIERDGEVYSCDHYVYPEYRLGNVREKTLAEMVQSPEQKKFGADKSDLLPKYCRECEVRFACRGECPKHRFLRAPDGEWGLNYLCEGYKRFFSHIDPHMRGMTDLLRRKRPPAEWMTMLADEERSNRAKTAGRNDPCPCGSGKKFKKCCMT